MKPYIAYDERIFKNLGGEYQFDFYQTDRHPVSVMNDAPSDRGELYQTIKKIKSEAYRDFYAHGGAEAPPEVRDRITLEVSKRTRELLNQNFILPPLLSDGPKMNFEDVTQLCLRSDPERKNPVTKFIEAGIYLHHPEFNYIPKTDNASELDGTFIELEIVKIKRLLDHILTSNLPKESKIQLSKKLCRIQIFLNLDKIFDNALYYQFYRCGESLFDDQIFFQKLFTKLEQFRKTKSSEEIYQYAEYAREQFNALLNVSSSY